MDVVYKVRQPVTGRIAALKILKPADMLLKLVGLEGLRRQFESEAVTMASLNHPNIAAIWDYDEAWGHPVFRDGILLPEPGDADGGKLPG